MYRAILFDLDGTLVQNDMQQFIAAFFATLGPRLAPFCKDIDHDKAVFASTRPLFNKIPSRVPLLEVFYREMSIYTGLPTDELHTLFKDYYENEYQQINIVKPVKGARECVELASKIAEKLVIATVPIFPDIAIKTRMRQGGIDHTHFDLVTNIETMHSSKPHLSYFREILDLIECGPQECLMIGNDHSDDMAAKGLGIETFLVKRFQLNKGRGKYPPDHSGSIKDLMKFLGQSA